MLKLLYTLWTDPLGLPIEPLWEYIILIVVGEVVHEIAFKVSPGGTFGSLIYWVTKLIAFATIWALLYVIIVVVKFIITYWIYFAIGGVVLLAVIVGLTIYNRVS